MPEFHIRIERVLQGRFEFRRLNLLLVFQVNCPGCFIYAFPEAQRIREVHGSEHFGVFGLSTAFEDFEYNTLEHTRLLLEESYLVGATRQYFQSQRRDFSAEAIDFPVAFDKQGTASEIFDDADLDAFCDRAGLATRFDSNSTDPPSTRSRVRDYLSAQPQLCYTFTINQLPGTPTWILFDNQFDLLARWFGHLPSHDVDALLQRLSGALDPVGQ